MARNTNCTIQTSSLYVNEKYIPVLLDTWVLVHVAHLVLSSSHAIGETRPKGNGLTNSKI